MIRTLVLESYRGFEHFEMHGFGRVNLIVGTNNVGKTSVLEAIHLVESPGDIGPLWSILTRRGEDLEVRAGESLIRRDVDVRRLFRGHEFRIGNALQVRIECELGISSFEASFSDVSSTSDHSQQYYQVAALEILSRVHSRPVALDLKWSLPQSEKVKGIREVLSPHGGLSSDVFKQMIRSANGSNILPVHFLSTATLSPESVIDSFEEIVLTPDEDFVLDALRVVEPSIERIATGGSERRQLPYNREGAKGGLLLRCRGLRDRIPIGSMGDGIWRILGLALSLANTKGGILLVDEIDTGLHYSVMEKMWQVVSQTATKLGIQVFATTHSRDCYESLASISRNVGAEESEITIQRIEKDKDVAVAYSEREIIAAAKRHLEVR